MLLLSVSTILEIELQVMFTDLRLIDMMLNSFLKPSTIALGQAVASTFTAPGFSSPASPTTVYEMEYSSEIPISCDIWFCTICRNSFPLALGTTSSLNTMLLEEKVTIASLSIISSALRFVTRRSARPERLMTSPFMIISSGTSTVRDFSILILPPVFSPLTMCTCLSEISNDSIYSSLHSR